MRRVQEWGAGSVSSPPSESSFSLSIGPRPPPEPGQQHRAPFMSATSRVRQTEGQERARLVRTGESLSKSLSKHYLIST